MSLTTGVVGATVSIVIPPKFVAGTVVVTTLPAASCPVVVNAVTVKLEACVVGVVTVYVPVKLVPAAGAVNVTVSPSLNVATICAPD